MSAPALTTTAQEATPASPTRKDPYFSNAKLILIVLVACGHAWAPLMDSDAVRAAYLVLYDLHMPAFILISGYLSRSFVGRPDQWRRLLTGVALPYVTFSLAYGLLRIYTEGRFEWNLLYPWYLMWFLPALFFWRLSAQIWKVVRWPVAVAFAISFAASLTALSDVLDLGRVLQFLPFFVIGTQLRREHFDMLRRTWIRVAGLVGTVALLGVAYVFGPSLSTEWVYYSQGYGQLETPLEWILPIRVGVFLAAGVLLVTFLAWVPDREWRLSALGERTIYAYLLHGFVIKVADGGLDLYRFEWLHTPGGAVLVTLLAAGLAVLLMTAPVTRMFRWAVEPRMPWLFTAQARRRPQKAAA
ncbi:acyltransferase family protein [Phytomonospora sp. NPDC050363]|uniref:acyltransferase family protein n=1 Tax=Phytomonospora sp. NPDC050363 TaxID=3155642 RepID=UPI0033EE3520